MQKSASFGLRRVLLIAVVGVFMLTLMVSGVSAVTGTFDPVSPGSATAPGPVFNAAPDPLEIEWELPEGIVGVVTYVFNIKLDDGPFAPIPVAPGDVTATGGIVTWTPTGASATAINAALVEGEFEWTVTATDDEGTSGDTGDDTSVTSTSFFFQVDLLAPGDFQLDGPAGASVETGVYLRELSTEQPITWTPAEGAEEYTFVLFQISNNTRIGVIVEMDELDPTAELGCGTPTDELCTLTADLAGLNLTTGQYAWTVIATNEQGETEASNAPYYFQVNIDPVELVRNGGFEAPVASPNNPTPAQWKRVNPSGERRLCNDTLPAGFSGVCAYKGTGGPVASMTQQVPGKLVKQLAIGAGDVITVNALVQSDNPVPAASKIVVTLVFGGAGSPKQNINVALANTPGTTFTAITTVPTDVQDLGNGTVKKITVKVVTKSKLFIDDVSVVLNSLVP
jgi:hypothetical protein